jgi:hypothetical protein
MHKTNKLLIDRNKALELEADNEKRLESLKLSSNNNQVKEMIEHGALIKLDDSVMNGYSNCVVDLSLFNARRFRINWSVNSIFTQLTHLPSSKTAFANAIQFTYPNFFTLKDHNLQKLNTIQRNCEKYLQIQLELSELITQQPKAKSKYVIDNESKRLAYIQSKRGTELIQQFYNCTEELRNNIGKTRLFFSLF